MIVKDTIMNKFNGSFTDWRIKLFGECDDPKKAEPYPMPTEHDDDDHDVVTGSPTYVSIDPSKGRPTSLPALPSDHQDRPINLKPTGTGSAVASPTATTTAIPDLPEEGSGKDEHFLPHLFPTFGVSKRTQIWIYGAVSIILLFCIGLGTYLFIQRRKRRRSEREDYEFEELLDEDINPDAGDARYPKRRAGELYDAFAGGSEDEDEGLLSETEDEDEAKQGYRDEPNGGYDEKRGRAKPETPT